MEWNVYLSPPKISYPTFTPQSKKLFSFFTLQKSSQTVMTFFANKYINIKKRGPFDSKEYCKDKNHTFNDYIDCEKKCFIDTFNVSMSIRYLFR